MKQIAVIGACCSRDVFNRNFISNYKDEFNLLYYSFQTSMISIMSSPVPYNRKQLNFKGERYSEWYRNILERELNKSFLNDLYSLQPENLLIDFYSDVIMGVLEIEKGASYISQRVKDQKNTAIYSILNVTDIIKPAISQDKYMDLWRLKTTLFFDWCADYLPNTKLLINKPYFIDKIEYPDGHIELYQNVDCDMYNQIYDEMRGFWHDGGYPASPLI